MNMVSIDLVAAVTIITAITLGVLGLVSWWVVLLILLTQCSLKFTWDRG